MPNLSQEQMMVELKPCPFCGGKAHWPEPEVNIPYVGCQECGACAQDEVRWNARAGSSVGAPDPQQSELHAHAGVDHAPGSGDCGKSGAILSTGDDAGLVERLRGPFDYDPGAMQDALFDAADRIEQLNAEVERLEEVKKSQGEAIDFACDHAGEMRFFLEDWRKDGAAEWDDFQRWKKVQREGALNHQDNRQNGGGE